MFSNNTKKAMIKAVLTKKSPFYVQFYVSKFCHLNCRMCNIVKANSDLIPFSSEQIEQIADNLVKIGAGVVLLTGGEPFLRKDIDEIVRIFKNRKLDVRMQTAGLEGQNSKIDQCVQYGARDINVSLDTLDSHLGDFINGRERSWERALKQISYISRSFPNKDGVCALGCVLSRYNIDEIEAVLDFSTEIGWWLSLVPVHITDQDNPMNFRGNKFDMRIPGDKQDQLYELIQRLKKKKREGYNLFDSDDYLDSIYHFVKYGTPNWRHNGVCDSPNLYFVILPDGRFAPCCDYRLDEDIKVYDPNFPQIYKSKEFQERVKKITKKCPGCNFGSFPEMTLSARSIHTQLERVKLQFKSKSKGIKPINEDEIFKIAAKVRERYPHIYENGVRKNGKDNTYGDSLL